MSKFRIKLFCKLIAAKIVKAVIKRNKASLAVEGNSFNYSFGYIIKNNSAADNQQNNFAGNVGKWQQVNFKLKEFSCKEDKNC